MPTSNGSRSIDSNNVSKKNSENNMPSINDNQNDTTSYKAALDARRERLAAMPEEQIARRIRLDVPAACTMASAAVQNVVELQGELVAQFGAIAEETLGSLDTTARAVRQADVEYEGHDEGIQLASIHRELVAIHERLLADTDSLAIRGLLSRDSVAAFRDPRSYQGALRGVLGLVSVLREKWSRVAEETPITVELLDEAERIAHRFEAALAKGPQANGRAAALETRTRALSMLVREYEQLRRMVGYLRHFEGDTDQYVPSLYAGRRGRKAKGNGDEDLGGDDETFVPPGGPVVNGGGPAVPVNGGPAFPVNGGPAFPTT